MSRNMIKKDSININRMTEQFSKKYDTLITFLSPDEIDLLVRQVIDELPEEMDFNPEFQMNFLIEKKFFLKARDEILSGNIDLEILIVDKYLSISKFLLRKLGITDSADQIAEEAIIESIENYDGKEGFKNTILKTLKRLLNPKSNKVEDGITTIGAVAIPKEEIDTVVINSAVSSQNVSSTTSKLNEPVADNTQISTTLQNNLDINETLTDDLDLVPNNNSLASNSSNSKNQDFQFDISNPELIRMPNQLELLIRSVDILHQVPIEDEMYLKFITLKYGYYQGQYFGLDEIASILSIPIEEVSNYYMQSLEYIKNWFGLQLDKMYMYYIKKSE